MPMTNQQKRNVTSAGIGAAALLVIVGWAIPKGADGALQAVDARYVRADTFRVFQQGLREARITDSAGIAGDLREIRYFMARLDSSDRCRRGQQRFCR